MADFVLVGLHLKDKSGVAYTVKEVLKLSDNGDDYHFNGEGNTSAFDYACDDYYTAIGFKLFDLNNLKFIDISVEDAFSLNIEGLYLSNLDKGKEEIPMNLFGLSANKMEDYNVELDYYLVAPYYDGSLIANNVSTGNEDVYFNLYLLILHMSSFNIRLQLDLVEYDYKLFGIDDFIFTKDSNNKNTIYNRFLVFDKNKRLKFVNKISSSVITVMDKVVLIRQGDGDIVVPNGIEFIAYKFNPLKMEEPFSLVIPPSVKDIKISYVDDERLRNLTFVVSHSVTDNFLRQLAGNRVSARGKDREDIILKLKLEPMLNFIKHLTL